jgi:hypothetical protein
MSPNNYKIYNYKIITLSSFEMTGLILLPELPQLPQCDEKLFHCPRGKTTPLPTQTCSHCSLIERVIITTKVLWKVFGTGKR